MTLSSFFRNFLILSAFLVLTACKSDLYTNIEENEANEMLALLLEHNIPAAKVPVKGTIVTLQVESNDIAQAIEILNANGYPKMSFSTMGQLFQKEGLISSPSEERIRYVFGLSQDLGKTISVVDGVIKAFVHIVVPESKPGMTVVEPSSASVLIKYNPLYDLQSQIPQIKLLVANAIEGLKYDNVAVVLFPAKDAVNISPKTDANTTSGLSFMIMIASGVVILMVLMSLIYFIFRKVKQ